MPEFIQQLIDRVQSFWLDLNQQQQIMAGIIAVVTVSVIGGLFYWSFQPQYVVLFNRKMSPEEASKIASALEERGEAYIVEDNVIKVPLSKVDRLRLQLAQDGIQPSSTVGFEIFEKGGIGITNYERQVRYKRALEGELVRALQSNPNYERAEVNVALPQKEALFEEDREEITASVKLQLKPFAKVNKEKVRGVVNLVSYGVVGLDAENVMVMNQEGEILSEDLQGESSVGDRQMQQLQVKREIEQKLERKLQQSLGRVLTRDRLAVAVTVNMDFDRVEKKMEEYRQPEDSFEQLVKKEKESDRHLEGGDIQPGGEAGVESNIPGSEMAEEGKTEYDETKSTVEYYADKNVTNIVQDPAITRVSALVTVDDKIRREYNDEGKIVFNYEDTSDEEIETIEELAKAAVGFSQERDDQVAVRNLRFDRADELRRRQEEAREAEFRRRVIYFSIIALGITFLIAGALLLWQKRREAAQEAEFEQEIQQQESEPARDLMAEVSVEEAEEEQEVKQLRQSVEENSETAAQVLRSWFVEEI
ncbi:MAG: flagellar basal-body MS-ring/collar protein FliF [bacterium]